MEAGLAREMCIRRRKTSGLIPFTRLRGVTAAWSIDSFPPAFRRPPWRYVAGGGKAANHAQTLKIGGTSVPELALYQTVGLDSEADPNLDALFMEELDIPIGGKTKDSSIQQYCRRAGAPREWGLVS
jgi:hypothetical protein